LFKFIDRVYYSDRHTVYMLNLALQFESATLAVGDIKVARFDVQDVIVSEMEMFDDRELGMILVDPTGMFQCPDNLPKIQHKVSDQNLSRRPDLHSNYCIP
jgi:hypothetical protein